MYFPHTSRVRVALCTVTTQRYARSTIASRSVRVPETTHNIVRFARQFRLHDSTVISIPTVVSTIRCRRERSSANKIYDSKMLVLIL